MGKGGADRHDKGRVRHDMIGQAGIDLSD